MDSLMILIVSVHRPGKVSQGCRQ